MEKQQRSKTLESVVLVGQRGVADYKKIRNKFIIQQRLLKEESVDTYTDDILSRV